MKHLKYFKETLIYHTDLKKFLPDQLTIDYDGLHTFKVGNVMKHSDMFQCTYTNVKNEFGYTDCLEIDIYTVMDSQTGKIRYDIDITVGDFTVSEFKLEAPNKISIIEHMSHGTKFCKDCPIFAFTDESIQKLVDFFNKLEHIQLTVNDLRFLNKRDDYEFD